MPSTSQRHLANLVNTMMMRAKLGSPIRILDMGCGDAHMLAYFAQTLPEKYPNQTFEWYGFEVLDIGWHGDTYRQKTIEFLSKHVPEYNWENQIATFSASDRWSYPSAHFDIIVSNQVLEHVRDHALVFSEIRRCLAPHAVSMHLFPLRETIYEVHAHMPIVHWIRNPERRRRVMTQFARLGLKRKYVEEKHFRGWTNLDEFGTIYSDVLETMTNYKTSNEILTMARDAGFHADFSYTKNFLFTKLLSITGRTADCYAAPNLLDRVTFPILKRLASATLVLRLG